MKLTQLKTFTLALLVLINLLVVSANAERTTTYFHTDAVGSVVAATDENGDLLWRKEYRPFGTQINNSDATEDTSFTGKQFDKDTGLSYFGARHYDPMLGRFVSLDPVTPLAAAGSQPFMFNRYAYANNNPYRYVDPDGRAVVQARAKFFRDKKHEFTFTIKTETKGSALVSAIRNLIPGRPKHVKRIGEGFDFVTKGQQVGVKASDVDKNDRDAFFALEAAMKKKFEAGGGKPLDRKQMKDFLNSFRESKNITLRKTFRKHYGNKQGDITKLLDAVEFARERSGEHVAESEGFKARLRHSNNKAERIDKAVNGK